jgi:transglutaminase-like putative cysteine protease
VTSQPATSKIERDPAPEDCLSATYYIDCEDLAIRDYAAKITGNQRERAIAAFYMVRDDIRYDAYSIDMQPEKMTASACLKLGRGFCVHKAVLLTAVARAAGVPTRVGFADVRNHLASQRLLDIIKTDMFIYHGYVEFHLDGEWVKATPAFNYSMCEKFGVLPLEFDGYTESLFHEFDQAGRKHMEYVKDRGSFSDLPFETMAHDFAELYGGIYDQGKALDGDMEAEYLAERPE